ncbi:hypothetical protein ONJ45_28345, partial [Salmonella enterica subsp. enterica serovar Virginia]|nr:hypothetical protein [Salmonella enterica subsp. enterica serovar Virginia]
METTPVRFFSEYIKSSVRLACLTLLFLGVGLGRLFHLYTEKNRDPEKCTAPVIVFYNNTQ